jgi:hypothetical protein
MQWNMDFCSSDIYSKKIHFNGVLFSIGHFIEDNYVAAWKNQIIFLIKKKRI